MITEATQIVTDLAGFFRALGDLSGAVAVVVKPWIEPLIAGFAAWWARRALMVSKDGNAVAAVAVKSAEKAAQVATDARTEINAKIDDHNANQAVLIQKGIERSEFERAIEIGVAKARSDFSPLATQPVKPS